MEPALKARFRAVGSRSQTFGLSIDTLWTPGASKGRSARRLLFQSSPLRRPLRARDPTGSDAFAAAPYCGGSYLTPAKWQMCGGSCSQKPRTRVRTGGAVSPRYAGSASRVAVSTNASVRPSLSSAKNSPTARSRLRRSVLSGRKVRARHRHRSGLKIPARPLSAPATPAKAGHAPCFIGPPALQKSAPEYRRLPATRPPVSLWTPQSRLRASSVTCASMRSF